MTLFISRLLMDKVETWINNTHKNIEAGGVFFGEGNRLRMFLPLPNISRNPDAAYQMGHKNSIEFFSTYFDHMKVVADAHTHPNGKVASEGDINYCRGISWPYHIIISDQGENFYWQTMTKEGNPIKLVVEDNISEDVWLSLAEASGLTDFGHVFLTPEGEILYDSNVASGLLSIDKDAFLVWKHLQQRNHSWLQKAELARNLNMTLYRLNKALGKLGITIK